MINAFMNKNLYKLFLSFVKFVPSILAFNKIITLALNYFKVNAFFATCFGGTSIIMIVLLYLISFLFKFCGLYRLSLNYVTLVTAISIFDWYIGIPISMDMTWRLYAIISGVFIITWIIIWYKNRHNKKIDHIKQLCDSYTDCNC